MRYLRTSSGYSLTASENGQNIMPFSGACSRDSGCREGKEIIHDEPARLFMQVIYHEHDTDRRQEIQCGAFKACE